MHTALSRSGYPLVRHLMNPAVYGRSPFCYGKEHAIETDLGERFRLAVDLPATA